MSEVVKDIGDRFHEFDYRAGQMEHIVYDGSLPTKSFLGAVLSRLRWTPPIVTLFNWRNPAS